MKRLRPENVNTPEHFDENIWSPDVNERPYFDATRHRCLARRLEPNDTVLDVGAGVFGTCQYLSTDGAAEAPRGLKLAAIDFSEVACVETHKRAPGIYYIVANFVPTIPCDTDSYDTVVSGETIEHMDDPAGFVAELCRVARRDVAISTVDPHCEDAQGIEYPEHLWDFTPEDLTGFFTPHMQEVSYEHFGDYHVIHARH